MKKQNNKIEFILLVAAVLSLLYLSCEKDQGPQYIKPIEKCLCDSTSFRDCYCDTLDPYPCTCDNTPYRDPSCWCDTIDPICDCDSTPYMDCYCDSYHPIYDCDCDTTPWRDCHCDTLQAIYACPCGDASKWKDCACDRDPVYICECDSTKYKDCDCDRDTIEKPVLVSFAKEIQPIVNKYCIECHYKGGDVIDYTFPDGYNNIISAIINPGIPDASPFYTFVYRGDMPPGEIFPDDLLEKIKQWILDGAQP